MTVQKTEAMKSKAQGAQMKTREDEGNKESPGKGITGHRFIQEGPEEESQTEEPNEGGE